VRKKASKKPHSTKKKVTKKKATKKLSKKVSRKTTTSKKSNAAGKPTVWSFLWGSIWRIGLAAIVFLLGYVLYLDLVITKRFEGQRWALPAHVYSRPLDIYVGRTLAIEDVETELQALGYQQQSSLDSVAKPGQFYKTPLSLTMYLRQFEFWDGVQSESKVEILWDADRIDDMRVNGELAADVRLEPRLFGSVSPLSHEDRSLITIEETPQALIDALLVMEDRKFYSHWGVDPLGIARAFVANFKAGKAIQGGSTLTQQLVKNYFLTSERKLKRKFIEMIMAFLLEFHYEKDEILQAYLNEVHLGQSGNRAVHGFGLGSQFIFGRPLSELKTHELATLAGMVKAPSSYNPLRNPERAKKRRDLVLDVMVDQGLIEKSLADEEKQISLKAVSGKAKKSLRTHPAFTDLVREQLKSDYDSKDLLDAGLKIFTTLDPKLQATLNTVVEDELEAISTSRGLGEDDLQVAAISVRTDNGEVVALAGSKTPLKAGFNRALHAKRPVGSLLKPMIALSAMQAEPNKFQLNSMLRDEPIIVSQKGPRALPSLILGAVEASVIDVAQLYMTLATGGFKTPLRSVRSVQTVDGEALDRYALDIEQVAEPAYCNLVSYAIQEALRSGTARSYKGRVSSDIGLAVKTGTTDGYRDSWFAGYSGDLLTVVWVGRDDNEPTGLTGSSGAGKVWFNYMEKLPLKPLDLDLTTDMVIGV